MGILSPDEPPPTVNVGDGVKVYLYPEFGRQDASVTRVHKLGVINCRTIKDNQDHVNIDHFNIAFADPELEPESYWVELPAGYVPGSEGH
jgi:hypothetical protein